MVLSPSYLRGDSINDTYDYIKTLENKTLTSLDVNLIDLDGWSFQYIKIGANVIRVNISKNLNGYSGCHRTDLNIKIPFTLPCRQYLFGQANVAGWSVAMNIFTFDEYGEVYYSTNGFTEYATAHASGILIVN